MPLRGLDAPSRSFEEASKVLAANEAARWFTDDSPRGEYNCLLSCSLCEGEAPFYNLPLGARLAPHHCLVYACLLPVSL